MEKNKKRSENCVAAPRFDLGNLIMCLFSHSRDPTGLSRGSLESSRGLSRALESLFKADAEIVLVFSDDTSSSGSSSELKSYQLQESYSDVLDVHLSSKPQKTKGNK
eukprot:990089-Amorphochlora_amoeboformis.AAC.1